MTRARSGNRWPTIRSRVARAGFTFIELLIVVFIISVLAAIALPAYRDYMLRAEAAEGLIFLGDAKGAVNEFYSRWGRMPADNREAGLHAPEAINGQYLRRFSVADGVMVATLDLGRDANGVSMERTLTMRPWVNDTNPATPIIWSCGNYDPKAPAGYRVIGELADKPIEDKYVPTACRR
jgi:type IV pilus assembly protein PilA